VLDFVGTVEAGELPDGRLIVLAHGPLDERIAAQFRDTLLPVASSDGVPVVLDLGAAHGLDAATMLVIARAAELVHDRGEQLIVVTRSPAVLSLLSQAGVETMVRVLPSLAEAIRDD
jgi:anti-anti-sigma factor